MYFFPNWVKWHWKNVSSSKRPWSRRTWEAKRGHQHKEKRLTISFLQLNQHCALSCISRIFSNWPIKAIWTLLLSYTGPFLKKQGQNTWIFFWYYLVWNRAKLFDLFLYHSVWNSFSCLTYSLFLVFVELSLCSCSTSLPFDFWESSGHSFG